MSCAQRPAPDIAHPLAGRHLAASAAASDAAAAQRRTSADHHSQQEALACSSAQAANSSAAGLTAAQAPLSPSLAAGALGDRCARDQTAGDPPAPEVKLAPRAGGGGADDDAKQPRQLRRSQAKKSDNDNCERDEGGARDFLTPAEIVSESGCEANDKQQHEQLEGDELRQQHWRSQAAQMGVRPSRPVAEVAPDDRGGANSTLASVQVVAPPTPTTSAASNSTRPRRPKRARTPTPAPPEAGQVAQADNCNHLPPPLSPRVASQSKQNLFTQQQPVSPRHQRPASALAGQLHAGSPHEQSDAQLPPLAGSARQSPNLLLPTASLAAGQNKSQQNNNNQGTSTSTNNNGAGKQKTTRVRINSTSEQIEDPNWLIQMSREFEAAASAGKKQSSTLAGIKKPSHLKSLQRRLKSTISIGGGGGASSSSNPSESQQEASNEPCETAVVLPPSTPVKVPVSILKQPSQTSSRPSRAAPQSTTTSARKVIQQDSLMQPRAKKRAGGLSPRKERGAKTPKGQAQDATSTKNAQRQTQTQETPVTAGKVARSKASSAQGKNQQEPNEPSQARNSSGPEQDKGQAVTKLSGEQAASLQQAQASLTPTRTPTPQQSANNSLSPSRPLVPICQDGQVKVSGWKRNNLLAKTLSHFDEIRGNQRPIFMPTKIMLAPDETPTSHSASSFQAGQQQQSPSISLTQALPSSPRVRTQQSSKFAELVREAISKKSLLNAAAAATAASNQNHQSDRQHLSHAAQQRQQQKRASDAGERHLASQHNETSASGQLAGEQHQSLQMRDPRRPMSADPSRSSVSSHSGSFKRQHANLASNQPSMAQIIAAAVAAAAQSDHNHQRASFSASPGGSAGASAAVSPAPLGASSRAFKLQLKNEQVLQNLRRQSNEMARVEAAQQAAGENAGHYTAGSSPKTSRSNSVHLKDWKRLTNKLGLLTGRSQVRSSAGHTPPSQVGATTTSASSSINPAALRLTVSNQESAGSGQRQNRKRGSGSASACGESLLVPNCEFAGGQRRRQSNQSNLGGNTTPETAGDRRKLSSSSMIVQPVTGSWQSNIDTPSSSQNNSRKQDSAGAGKLFKSTVKLMGGRGQGSRSAAIASPLLSAHLDQTATLRRSSDSEACRPGSSALVGGGSACQVQQNRPLDGPILRAGSGSQIDGGSSSIGGADLGPKSSSQVSLPSNNNNKPPIPIVVHRDDLLKLHKQVNTAAGQTQVVANEISSSNLQADGSSQSPSENSIGDQQLAKQDQEQPKSRANDLIWVVRRTSKVAFFQQKLRKMRWHSKQQQQQLELQRSQQAAAAESVEEAQNGDSANVASTTSEASEASKTGKSGADIAMDPALIGDAIESFLRTSMQQQQFVEGGEASGAREAGTSGGCNSSETLVRRASSSEQEVLVNR